MGVRPARRRRRPLAAFLIAAAAVLAVGPPALAEPYLGLRLGRPCSACHVNVTGGGMRNAHGVSYGLRRMPRRPASDEDAVDPFEGRVTEFISMGADLRAAHESTWARSGNANEFEVSEGNLYADLQVIRGRLHLYLDEHVAPGGAATREAFALLEGLPGRLHVKAGRFYPAYGWRLLDDEAFIRAGTGFNFDRPDDGFEVGWSPGRLASTLSVTNGGGGGAEQDENKQVSILSAWTSDRFRAGWSAAANRSADESRRLAGLLAGVRIGPLVVLGEADAARAESLTGAPSPGSLRTTVRQVITYLEADLLVAGGWNLKAAHDWFDPDTSQDGDEVDRIGAGVEYTPGPYTQLRLLWRRTDRPPVVRGLTFEDDREVIAELHIFL